MTGYYPRQIHERFLDPENCGFCADCSGRGVSASFTCGAFVRFELSIDADAKSVNAAAFRSNGCGFMIAAADVLAELISGRKLDDLHGLDPGRVLSEIQSALCEFPPERRHCALVSIEAMQAAFADHRESRLDEFRGEQAVICTCFGVSEDTIEKCIASAGLRSVEAVGESCKAGTGCGACRMLIREMLDQAAREG